jgi:hypothetical protein
MPIQKIVTRSVVLLEAQSPAHARREIEEGEPIDLVTRCDNGDAVGSFEIVSIEQLPAGRVRNELIALGNTGGDFFEPQLDFLATAHALFVFASAGEDPQTRATALLCDMIEKDDLIGEGGVLEVTPTSDGQYQARAELLFRSQGETLADAATFAQSRIDDVVDASALLMSGTLAKIEDDSE